ncbi:hypothetical protein AB0958_19105 [Streptomyces sp. NPDC006655]|uniref:hypothetical protein n=1 Tax=Streptomyces sp. NPDC006655 TaxID=3156898 RepID=UPI00345575D7
MSQPERAPHRTALAYEIASDPHWVTAGSTRQGGPLELPERRATRSSAGTPYNLTVYDLALELDSDLAEFAERHSVDVEIPTGRTAVADYAARLAERGGAARAEYEELCFLHDLRAALAIGDADDLLGKLVCPACKCWSLVGTRAPSGARAVACRVVRCAPEPGTPRVHSLRAVVRHHFKPRRDATAA